MEGEKKYREYHLKGLTSSLRREMIRRSRKRRAKRLAHNKEPLPGQSEHSQSRRTGYREVRSLLEVEGLGDTFLSKDGEEVE